MEICFFNFIIIQFLILTSYLLAEGFLSQCWPTCSWCCLHSLLPLAGLSALFIAIIAALVVSVTACVMACVILCSDVISFNFPFFSYVLMRMPYMEIPSLCVYIFNSALCVCFCILCVDVDINLLRICAYLNFTITMSTLLHPGQKLWQVAPWCLLWPSAPWTILLGPPQCRRKSLISVISLYYVT